MQRKVTVGASRSDQQCISMGHNMKTTKIIENIGYEFFQLRVKIPSIPFAHFPFLSVSQKVFDKSIFRFFNLLFLTN